MSASSNMSTVQPRRIHRLKTVQPYFDDILLERKPFEIRKDDRGFEVGDVLILDEYAPAEDRYPGPFAVREVTYLVRGVYGLPEDVCVMAVKYTSLTYAEMLSVPERSP